MAGGGNPDDSLFHLNDKLFADADYFLVSDMFEQCEQYDKASHAVKDG